MKTSERRFFCQERNVTKEFNDKTPHHQLLLTKKFMKGINDNE